MKLKVKKLPIIIPLALVAAILISTVVTSRLGLDTAEAHIDLGRKHLKDGDYASATTEFLQGLSRDPTSRDARLGLAEAYMRSDAEGTVEEILQPLLDSEDPEAYRFLAESRRGSDPAGALIAAQSLVSKTDKEEDYALRNELMSAVMNEAHPYAVGTDQTLAIVDGKVMSRGQNTLGQLGTVTGLGTDAITDVLTDAGFTGVPSRVYCVGRTSLVIDAAGVLWGAGENRWGQEGTGRMSTVPASGWTKLADNVASVAGTPGALFTLKTDGSLWYSGQGGIAEPAPVTSFGTVCAIDSTPTRTAVLTAEGTLFVSYSGDPLHFTRAASNVKCFLLSDYYDLIWVTADNTLCGNYYLPTVPEEWAWNSSGAVVDFTVTDMASADADILFLDNDGTVRCLSNGNITTFNENAVSLSQSRDGAVIRYADSTSEIYASGTTTVPLR